MRLWSSSGELLATSKQPVYGAKRVAFSEDGRFIAASARSPYLSVVNVAEGLTATTLAKHDEIGDPTVNARYIAAMTSDHTRVRIWESSGGRELPPVDADHVDKLEFDGTGKFLAIRQWDSRAKIGVVRIWDVAQSRETGRLSIQGVGDFAISPEGRFLALNSWEKAAGTSPGNDYLEVWDVSSGTRVSRISQDGAAGYLAFYSGKWLLTIASDSQTVQVWDVPAGNLRARLPHEENVLGIRVNPKDGVLATLSAGLVYVWNPSTGELLTQLAAAGRVVDFKFTPDGRRLLTGNDEGIAALWLWKTEDLQEEACKRLTRNLSQSEWRQYLGAIPYQRSCANLPVPE
jgi:WD40 repeat protein